MEIKKVFIKENNGGGISYEAYGSDDNIIAVISGIEQQSPQPDYRQEARDLIEGNWTYSDASQWYDANGNSMGDRNIQQDDMGNDIDLGELTAYDVIDNHAATKTIDIIL